MSEVSNQIIDDIKLLEKDKRVQSIEYKDDVVTIYTEEMWAYDNTYKPYRRALIGKLKIKYFPEAVVGDDQFNFPFTVKNLDKSNGAATPHLWPAHNEKVKYTADCWASYHAPFLKAFKRKDLIEIVELLFRFSQGAYEGVPHHEQEFFGPGGVVQRLVNGEYK